jgi:Bifunctional DNA primase/polymerase, N-terminal
MMADITDDASNTPAKPEPVVVVSESLRRKRALNGATAPAAMLPQQETPEAKAAAANLAAGLEYAAAGMAVFPVSAAKKPLTEHGYLDASVDPKVIKAWHRQWAHCEWAWSVPDEILVADVDRKNGRDGYADFQRLFGLHPRDAGTPMATTPSGGLHLFYRASKAYKNVAAIDGTGIDARSGGGYVLLPIRGNGREWLRPYVGATGMLDAPEWFDRIERAPPGTAPPASPLSTDAKVLDRGRFALEQACHAIENAPNGAQEFTLNKRAYTVGGMVARGDIAWEEAREELIAAAKRMPIHGKPWRKLDAKVERALEDGMARPLSPRDSDGDSGFTALDDPADDDEDDEDLLARRMPTIDPKAFYGVLGPLVTATTMRSEATKVGIALQTIAHVSLTMRPFYKPRDDGKAPFNTFNVQLGLSAAGRKGTSAEVPDNHLAPAIMRLARTVEAQLAFVDEDGMIRLDAESAVAAASRKLEWVTRLNDFALIETEMEIETLENESAEATAEIKKLKTTLARTKSPRTMKECKAGIAEAEARIADIVDRIAEAEAYLAEMQAVLKDQSAAVASAQKTHAAAMKALAALPPSGKAPDEPWLSLFASLANGAVTARGISTGEGLVELIRDPGIKAGNHGPVADPGVETKVAFLNLEELGGVLAVSTRPGATLSTMLRTAFDCKPLELINKTSPLRCAQPYVVLAAGCTPAEFMGKLFAKGDTAYSADNGLANRFFCVWVMRDRIEPDPQPTPGLAAMMDAIARNILRVYEVLKPNGPFLSTPIDFSAQAKALYGRWYVENETRAATSANAAKLIKRKVVHMWKIAGVLAMMNGEFEISAGALEAAIAWVDYATATIDVIASTAAERKKMKVLTDDGKKVLEAAKELGADEAPASAYAVRRKTPFDKKRFDAAVASLLRMGPSPITLLDEEYVSGKGVRHTRAVIGLRPMSQPIDFASERNGEDAY